MDNLLIVSPYTAAFLYFSLKKYYCFFTSVGTDRFNIKNNSNSNNYYLNIPIVQMVRTTSFNLDNGAIVIVICQWQPVVPFNTSSNLLLIHPCNQCIHYKLCKRSLYTKHILQSAWSKVQITPHLSHYYDQ